jgi:multicomponent Na+:H+ antiporter subunit D
MAINGACAHAFAHILYKGLLFMGCGAVLHMTGESKFTELGGLWKKMPWTFVSPWSAACRSPLSPV